MKKIFYLAAFVIFYTNYAGAQSLAINTDGSIANASALLDVKSTAKGMLIPRMSKAEKNAIAAPATGLLIFQNAPDSIGFYYYSGTAWLWLANTAQQDTAAWKTNGNTGTNINTHFIGTTDNVALSFRQNNIWQGRWNSFASNYFIGDSAGIVTTGTRNVGIGAGVLKNNNTGFGNTALGNIALQNNTTGVVNVAVGYDAMNSNTTGNQNVAVGWIALKGNLNGEFNTAVGAAAHRYAKSGDRNSYVGYVAGYSDSIGNNNTGIGNGALYKHQTGNFNTAIGSSAMQEDSSGNWNTAVGSNASLFNDTATQNTAIGFYALRNNKRSQITAVGAYAGSYNGYLGTNNNQGIENTIIGFGAMTGNTFGSQNTAIGYKAMSLTEPLTYLPGVSPSRNIAIGDSAMRHNLGNDNIGIGFRALAAPLSNASSNNNIAVGSNAMYNNISGTGNVAMGHQALYESAGSDYNIAIGNDALRSNLLGEKNTAVGTNALFYNKNGNLKTAVGFGALYYDSVGLVNTAVGGEALYNNGSGSFNNAFGRSALYRNESGDGNIGIGYRALYNSAASDFNVAIGHVTLFNHKRVGASYNVAIGASALEQDSSGYENTGVGVSSFRFNKTGVFNCGLGINTGYNQRGSNNSFVGAYSGFGQRINIANTVLNTGSNNAGLGGNSLFSLANGISNVAVGEGALYSDSSGSYNVALGKDALRNIITGNYNSSLGYNTDVSLGSFTNTTTIGAYAYATQSNSLILGSISGTNGATANTNVGIGTTAPAARLDVSANFRLGANGTTLNDIIKSTETYDIPSLAPGAVDIQTFAVPNVNLGSAVSFSPLLALPDGITISYARVSAAGTVEVKVVNAGTATQNPASMSFILVAIR